MKKPIKSSLQNLSISYELALAIGNSLNLSEMLHEVIHKIVHKTNAHRGIIWVRNETQELQAVASAGINIEDVQAQGEIMDTKGIFNQILKSRQFVLKYKDDKDFLQYCPILTEKEESVLIVPVSNLAILYLVYASREIADEPLANLLAGLSKKLSVAIEACMAHKNIINEVQVRVEAEEKIQHLNLVLRAIRNVNQLIVFEKNKDVLIQKVCEILTEDRGYNNAWIVLFGEQREYINSAEAGLGKTFIPMKKMMEEGTLTNCGNDALKKNDLIIIKDPKKECLDCPLSTNYSGRSGYTICIKHGDNIYGLLSVSASGYYVNDKEEQGLFKEVAGDIGFALYNIEVEEKHKQAEEALQERESQLRAVLDNATIHIWAFDGELYPYLSKEWYRYTGQDPTLPRTIERWTEVVHPDDLDEAVKTWLKAWDSKSIYDGYFRLRNSKGKYRLFHSHAVPVNDEKDKLLHYQGYNIDITERKQAEKTLQESEEILRNIFEHSTNAFYSHTPEHILTYMSPQVEEILGYKADEALRKWTEFASDNPVNKIGFELTQKAIKTGKPQPSYELEFIHKNEKKVWIEVHEGPVVIDGKTISIVGAFTDITDRKKAEEELNKHREHLEELIKERTKELEEKNKELERFNNLFVNREFRIKELRDKVKELEKKNEKN